MSLIYDVQVNWVDGAARGYEIPRHFEWEEQDKLEIMAIIPLLRIEPELFTYIENSYGELPIDLLDLMYNRAKRRLKGSVAVVEYAAILTDGNRILAIDTLGDVMPHRKSRLTFFSENNVLIKARDKEIYRFDWEIPKYPDVSELSLAAKLTHMRPEYLLGLTRSERAMKEIVMGCLFQVLLSHPIQVHYWYSELFRSADANKILDTPEEELVEEMFDFVKVGWSQRHEDFGSALVVLYDLYAPEWKRLKSSVAVTN